MDSIPRGRNSGSKYVRWGLFLILGVIALIDTGCNAGLRHERHSRRSQHRLERGHRISRHDRGRKHLRHRDYAYADDDDCYCDDAYDGDYYYDEGLVAGLPNAPYAPSCSSCQQPDMAVFPGTTYPGTTYPGMTYPGTTYPGTTYPGTVYPGTTYPAPMINSMPYDPTGSVQPTYSIQP